MAERVGGGDAPVEDVHDSYDYDRIEAEMEFVPLSDGAVGASSDDESVLMTLVQSYDWPGVLYRVDSHPEEAEFVGIQGRTPLHCACHQDAPPFVVHALLLAYPTACSTVGTSEMTPLHITCSSQHASIDVVRVLLNGSPAKGKETSMRDVDGDTPLHTACRCGAPFEVLEALLRANPSVVNERDYEGLTPLLRLWVRYFVTLGAEVIGAVKGPADLSAELTEAWEKTKLLLRAAQYGSLEDATSTRRRVFRAVHAVAGVDCPREIVRIATAVHSEQVTQQDEAGLYPLMIAAKAPTFKVHDLSGDGYSIEDRILGDTHVDKCETGTDAENYTDDCHSLEPSVIEILLDASTKPASATCPSPDGSLPLHLALVSGKRWSQGVESLLRAYPEALMIPDNTTRLYPFMLAGVGERADCNTIYELLKANPALIKLGLVRG